MKSESPYDFYFRCVGLTAAEQNKLREMIDKATLEMSSGKMVTITFQPPHSEPCGKRLGAVVRRNNMTTPVCCALPLHHPGKHRTEMRNDTTFADIVEWEG